MTDFFNRYRPYPTPSGRTRRAIGPASVAARAAAPATKATVPPVQVLSLCRVAIERAFLAMAAPAGTTHNCVDRPNRSPLPTFRPAGSGSPRSTRSKRRPGEVAVLQRLEAEGKWKGSSPCGEDRVSSCFDWCGSAASSGG